jgi:Tol biopolymer transport system component
LAVSPDGSTVVFEVTDDFAILPLARVPPEQEGIFMVRADGSRLRRLGPASREAGFRVVLDPATPTGINTFLVPTLDFSPDGRRVVFTDIGPGPAGEDAAQVVALDLASGRRTQVTHLPSGVPPDPLFPVTCCPSFIDDDTISFSTFTDPDGSKPRR